MLLDFYKEEKITRSQLFVSNFMNQLPAFFLHLPTTFFIVIPLTGWAGALYFLLTFAAVMLRTICLAFYGHFRLSKDPGTADKDFTKKTATHRKKAQNIWQGVKQKFPRRIKKIAIYVVPIYILVFILNDMGLFKMARHWLAGYVVTAFIPMEALSVVVLSFTAEFTSGFAAAGALLDAGVLTIKQTAMALLIGNIIAFPSVAALYRHLFTQDGRPAAGDGAGTANRQHHFGWEYLLLCRLNKRRFFQCLNRSTPSGFEERLFEP
jgi:hypothetical protein